MTDTMLQRMAAAAAWEFTPIPWDDLEEGVQLQFIKAQRAALRSVRTPTAAMIKASQALWTFEGRYHSDAPAEEQWPAMVDAILKEGPK